MLARWWLISLLFSNLHVERKSFGHTPKNANSNYNPLLDLRRWNVFLSHLSHSESWGFQDGVRLLLQWWRRSIWKLLQVRSTGSLGRFWALCCSAKKSSEGCLLRGNPESLQRKRGHMWDFFPTPQSKSLRGFCSSVECFVPIQIISNSWRNLYSIDIRRKREVNSKQPLVVAAGKLVLPGPEGRILTHHVSNAGT